MSLSKTAPFGTLLIFSLKNAPKEWLLKDAPTLIYMAKATLAALLALMISMMLTLPDPRTAIFTTFIVMQPQSGLVFSKSYYRVLGTIAGVVVSFLMVGAFAQEPMWFIFFFAIWIGITTAAGVKYRNFQSYGFVLAGYTLCIVALPVIEQPMEIFNIATSRFSEVMVGILCATVVSEIFFPRKLSDSLLTSERERFESVLASLVDENSLFGAQDMKDAEVVKFSSGVVGVHAVAVNSAFESAIDKRNRLYLEQLNIEFMHLSTTFHSLKNIVGNIELHTSNETVDNLKKLYAPFAKVLQNVSNLDEEGFHSMINQLKELKEIIHSRFTEQQNSLEAHFGSDEYDAFRSAGYLITRILDEFFIYANSYLAFYRLKSSGKATKELSRVVRFKTHTDNLLVTLAALRGSGVLLITMAFWILSGWKYGTLTITMAVVIGLLIGTLPRPLDAVINFLKGAVSAAFVAALYDFYIVPEFATDAYTLSLVVTPVFAFVGWMTTKPKWAGFSLGFVFLFMSQTSFDLYYKIDPTTFLETTIASLLGVSFAGAAYMLVNFWSCSLSQKRVAKVLRGQIVFLCNAPLNFQRGSLESMGRDMIQQFSTQGQLNIRSNRLVYEWLLATLEIGGAIIRVRKNLNRLNGEFKMINQSLEGIKQYFQAPTEALRQSLLESLKNAIKSLHVEHKQEANIVAELPLIRTILLSRVSIPMPKEGSCR
ncbi:FUSC family protein [Sulfurimonas sp.]|uniref:FUSC family protein n=1 Tax=Sulfurimonas sp. TaxID=2022749 RepID=UPI0025F48BB4|nr:FUSC family protein [Sulfurimonas sp.]MDD5157923.1 FUSC family protein [Sulfurimonas sp.]